jgi:hypothetical protein
MAFQNPKFNIGQYFADEAERRLSDRESAIAFQEREDAVKQREEAGRIKQKAESGLPLRPTDPDFNAVEAYWKSNQKQTPKEVSESTPMNDSVVPSVQTETSDVESPPVKPATTPSSGLLASNMSVGAGVEKPAGTPVDTRTPIEKNPTPFMSPIERASEARSVVRANRDARDEARTNKAYKEGMEALESGRDVGTMETGGARQVAIDAARKKREDSAYDYMNRRGRMGATA